LFWLALHCSVQSAQDSLAYIDSYVHELRPTGISDYYYSLI
jgi:hypothetical protein